MKTKIKKITLRLINFEGFLSEDPKCDMSGDLFDHLKAELDDGTAVYVGEHLKWIKRLAEAHGWKVVLRNPTAKEITELSDDEE